MPTARAWQSMWPRLPEPLQDAARAARRVVDPRRRRAHAIRIAYDAAADVVRRSTGHVVASGPFAGMRYIDRRSAAWAGNLSAEAPFLLGSYEAELHEQVEALIARGYDRVVDIGSAEGYYAVGFARRLPAAHVVAFDVNPVARDLCERMAQMNGVADRVEVLGEATSDRLRPVLTPGALVLCDCEGCEVSLLDPDAVPELRHVDLVVELHDFLRDGITPTLLERFAPTHDVVRVQARRRDPAPYAQWLAGVPDWIREWVVAEFRGGLIEPHHAEWGIFLRRAGS